MHALKRDEKKKRRGIKAARSSTIFTTTHFADRPNVAQLIPGSEVEESQAIQRPALAQISHEGNVNVAVVRLEASLVVQTGKLEYHANYRGQNFYENVLEDA